MSCPEFRIGMQRNDRMFYIGLGIQKSQDARFFFLFFFFFMMSMVKEEEEGGRDLFLC